jgi:hypothetical protein
MVQEIDSEPKEPEPGRKEQTHVILLLMCVSVTKNYELHETSQII